MYARVWGVQWQAFLDLSHMKELALLNLSHNNIEAVPAGALKHGAECMKVQQQAGMHASVWLCLLLQASSSLHGSVSPP